MAIHLRPTAATASAALLTGDPGRALALATDLLTAPRMSNHHRGLWGYHGETADGRKLTIQSTGLGGPSGAIVLTELARLGVRRVVRIGTCESLGPELRLGQLIVAERALADDGTSRGLGVEGCARASATLTRALADALGRDVAVATVATTDLFYGRRDGEGWWRAGCVAVELQAAALFGLAGELGVEAGCVLAVSGFAGAEEGRIGDEELDAASLRMGRAALMAVGQSGPGTGNVP